MGLDMYGYARKGDDKDSQVEIAYWRKHNRLHGWMEDLWQEKKNQRSEGDKFIDGLDGQEHDEFNCVEMELSLEDLDRLEDELDNLPETSGFFFGNDSYGRYTEEDRKFIEDARQKISEGYEVYYSSWW